MKFAAAVVSAVLLATGETGGDLAYLAVAFLIGPFGLPGAGQWLIKRLAGLSSRLIGFIIF